jgi:organic radical activating enzyme
MTVNKDDMNWEKSSTGMIKHSTTNIETTKKLLDKTGCGFCLAKFTQVTMHLGTGMVHSCHHPATHKIDPVAVAKNPNVLFNTPQLKIARKEMLNDQKPSECGYCWRVENDNQNSDRFSKSLSDWALPEHDDIVNKTGNEDFFPTYLEVSFGNACNLKCIYCGPEFSSKWVEELKQNGPVTILKDSPQEQIVQGWQDLDNITIKNRDYNPYIEAFWKWFPNAYPKLKNYRITGGEPLMNKETFRSMDWLIANPNLSLDFSINSNLSVPDKLWNKFVDKLQIMRTDTVKKITIHVSAESVSSHAEYARSGLDYELMKKRVVELLEIGNIRVSFMSTYNVLSAPTFGEWLKWVLSLKRKYNFDHSGSKVFRDTGFSVNDNADLSINPHPDHNVIVGIDIPYLRHPEMLDAQYCSDDLVSKYMLPDLKFMMENSGYLGFEEHEIVKLRRIVHHRAHFLKKDDVSVRRDVDKQRAAFADFIDQMDSRRNTSFSDIHPELADFMQLCRNAKISMSGDSNDL